MATNIGGMLAQGGAMAGQQIGGGFQSVLGGLGGMLQSRADKQRREAEAQEVQNFIAKNANNPAAINAEGLRRQTLDPNDPLADVFFKAAQQAVTQQRGAGLQSMSVIRQKMQTEKDPARLLELENALVSVARQTGQSDPSAYIGEAAKITDERTRRDNALFAQRENAIGQAYYSVSNEDKDVFVKNAKQAGFGKIVTQLDNERMRHENYVEEKERKAKDARSPLPIPSLEKRIKDLPESQRAQFEEQLKEIKKLEPDFENGETWGTGERERAWRLLDSLDSNLFRANVSIISASNERINTLNSRLNSIDKELRKPASAQESKLFITEAIEQASSERGLLDYVAVDLKPTDSRVQQKAIELATEKKNAELERERSQIEAELLELEKSLSPASTDTESTNEDDVIDL